ncbi:DUF4030 domain-containing protein [Peribacillus butanolivorans]|jgi:hypothetical protein
MNESKIAVCDFHNTCELEKVFDDFLKSEQMKSKVKNDPYHITIYSKDNKKINGIR